jgi:hypothetical protein
MKWSNISNRTAGFARWEEFYGINYDNWVSVFPFSNWRISAQISTKLGTKLCHWISFDFHYSQFPIIIDKILAYQWNSEFGLLVLTINTLNAELNPVSHLLALLGPHHILHVSMIRAKLWPIANVWNICSSLKQYFVGRKILTCRTSTYFLQLSASW